MRRPLLILAVAVLALYACGGRASSSSTPTGDTISSHQLPPPPTLASLTHQRACSIWVDSVYSSLTERERVAQLFVPVVNPKDGDASRAVIRKLVKKNGVGGLLFSSGSLSQHADMIRYAQSVAKVPLLITLDGEWGLSMRIDSTSQFPYNMGLGAIRNDSLLRDYGREVARECRAMGIHVNFAPVLDVNSNPANPVIGFRSFGDNPDRVASAGCAYSLGLEESGVMSVAKHFPGHGDTSTDSHKALPTVDHTRAVLDSIDMAPFASYIRSGMSGVMVGHLSVPALDQSLAPASLSRPIVTGILRDSLDFQGLIFTDALAMKGAVSNENNCIGALRAGADVLLSSLAPASDIDAVMRAVADGKISAADIESRCRKVLAYKWVLEIDSAFAAPDTAALAPIINSPEADALNRRLSAAMITVVRNDSNLLPVHDLDTTSIAIVNIGATRHNTFSDYCLKYADADLYSSTGGGFSHAEAKEILEHDIVIIGIYTDHGWAREAMIRFAGAKNAVPVFFMSPYKMAKFKTSLYGVPTLAIAYDDTRYLEEYAAQGLFGGIAVDGRLPVNLPGVAEVGAGVELPKTRLGFASPVMAGMSDSLGIRIDSIVAEGLREKAFPGCQVLVAKDGDVVWNRSYGHISSTSGAPVTSATIYDLASVSKATGTLPGIMKAFDMGLFAIDDPASAYIPGLRDTEKASITIRDLLYHESGIVAALSMNDIMMDPESYTGPLMTRRPDKTHRIRINKKLYGHNKAHIRRDITSAKRTDRFPVEAAEGVWVGQETFDTIMARIYTSKLRSTTDYNYSCLNFALLMDMEQRLTDIPHDRFVHDSIFAPLGAYHTGYRPTTYYNKENIAPTEKDPFVRRQTVRGYVHDEMAAMSGGVQGNAGLFSNAEDLAKLCQMWLNGGSYGGRRVLSGETVELFTTSKSATCRRGLGFDKPDTADPSSSPVPEEASPATYGHIGFTGTCFWVDPEYQLIYIFLCNRVNPTRDNAAFSRLNIRPALLRAIYRSM